MEYIYWITVYLLLFLLGFSVFIHFLTLLLYLNGISTIDKRWNNDKCRVKISFDPENWELFVLPTIILVNPNHKVFETEKRKGFIILFRWLNSCFLIGYLK